MTSFAEYAAMMVGAERAMSADLRAELEEFECSLHDPESNAQLGTSDWPSWIDLIGPPPYVKDPALFQRKDVSPSLRRRVLERDGACLHCGTDEDLTMDHVIPVAHGGPTTFENLQTLCRSCNTKKGALVFV